MTRLDFVILDELGYLPFAQSGGQLIFHLISRLYERQDDVREMMNFAAPDDAPLRRDLARRPKFLLSGLIKCDCCGANYILINRTRYGCSGTRNKGLAICDNRATIGREDLEARVLGGLKDRLMHPDLVAVFVEEYLRAWNEAQAGQAAARTKAERDLAQVERKIAGILSAIEDGLYEPSMKARMEELKVEKARLSSNLAQSPEPPALRLHPG